MQTVLNLRLHQCHYLGHVTSIRTLTASKLKEYYDLLKVNRNSSPKEIKESFLRLSKQYHPDNKVTGSHNKFVNLKQAYDAIKDGPPATTSSPASQYPRYTASYEDLSHKAYRDKQRYQYNQYERPRGKSSFSGPHSYSDTPWEDMMKERLRTRENSYYSGDRGFWGFTRHVLILSFFFYLFIFGGVRALIERNDNIKRKAHMVRVRSQEDYETYERYLKDRSEERRNRINRIAAEKRVKPKYSPMKDSEEGGKRDTTAKREEISDPEELSVEFIR